MRPDNTERMIYRRRRRGSVIRPGFYRFESQQRRHMFGYGDGDFVRLRDEFGNVWQGIAEEGEDNTVRFIFRDPDGRRISGVSDSYGVTLRDEFGNTWRGFID